MSRITRKSVIWLMVLTLVITFLPGCSGDQGNSPNQVSSSEQTASVSKETSQTDDMPEKYTEAYDQMLVEKELERWEPLEEFADKPKYKISWFSFETPASKDVFAFQMVNKMFNVEIEPVLRQADELMTMVASGDLPDVICVLGNNPSTVSSLYDQGVLAPISVDKFKENMPQYYDEIMDIDPSGLLSYSLNPEELMAIPITVIFNTYPFPGVIRADWLNNVGWNKLPKTIDELDEVFRAFANNDPDKNGKKDTYALSMPSDQDGWTWFHPIFGSFGINPFYWQVNKSNELELGFTTKAFKDAMILLNKWYKEGIIDPEFVTDVGRSLQADICLKFSEGRIGYMYNVDFSDLQYDNDGNVNAKWMANNEDWLKWFTDNKDNPDVVYATSLPTDFDDSMRDPYYIALPPVSSDYSSGYYAKPSAFGKQLMFSSNVLKESGKMERIMQIINYQAVDPDFYLRMWQGPQGIAWDYDEQGKIKMQSDASMHPYYSPNGVHLGNYNIIGILSNATRKMSTIMGDARTIQRFERTGVPISNFPGISNMANITTETSVKNPELMTRWIQEYIVNGIIDGNIEKTYPEYLERWKKAGGEDLINEINEWYRSVQ